MRYWNCFSLFFSLVIISISYDDFFLDNRINHSSFINFESLCEIVCIGDSFQELNCFVATETITKPSSSNVWWFCVLITISFNTLRIVR